MHEKIKNATNYLPKRLASTLDLLLKDEAISGKLLLAAAILALIVVNSPLKHLYDSIWHLNFSVGLGGFSLSHDLRHWVNDGLMAIFFLVVGLEIKREVRKGELRRPRAAILPIAAAIGGMVVPALIFVAFNIGSESVKGWGIPVATDIAFAIGILALLGSRIPSSLKVFLLTLAIVDDLLAIIIIAIFYTAHINLSALLVSIVVAVLLLTFRKVWPRSIVPYAILGICLWAAVQSSGVHATIAGALIGFLAPTSSRDGPSIAERLETAMIPISTFVVIPLFAFANAGVVLSGIVFSDETVPIVLGVVFGLVFGKVIGVLGVVWILTKLRLATLPHDLRWRHMTGLSLVAGIGFTVSIFITELAFAHSEEYILAAKVGIIIASIFAAIAGSTVLMFLDRKDSQE
jgi:Na+:H+ antiporter, NhaA family